MVSENAVVIYVGLVLDLRTLFGNFFGNKRCTYKKNNFGIIGLHFEKETSPIKVQRFLNERPRADKPS